MTIKRPATMEHHLHGVIESLGDEIQDVDEETFNLFSHSASSQDLGMYDAQAEETTVSIAGKDYSLTQSPGILRSNRESGTTGAVIWRTSINFAEWLAAPSNVLFAGRSLNSDSVVLELGTGISALVPLVLRGMVGRVIATDQQYALKLLQKNIAANTALPKTKDARRARHAENAAREGGIEVLPLDWETDDLRDFLRLQKLDAGVDAILVCDCIFNYALIQPLVETCADLCRARNGHDKDRSASSRPTICVIAQQLRQPDVFEQWLKAFMLHFRVWRMPDEHLIAGTREEQGFVIHVGILRSCGV